MQYVEKTASKSFHLLEKEAAGAKSQLQALNGLKEWLIGSHDSAEGSLKMPKVA